MPKRRLVKTATKGRKKGVAIVKDLEEVPKVDASIEARRKRGATKSVEEILEGITASESSSKGEEEEVFLNPRRDCLRKDEL